MTTRQQLLNAIATDPQNRAHQLVFADWLEEHGSPLAALWRQFAPAPTMLIDNYYNRIGTGWGDGNGEEGRHEDFGGGWGGGIANDTGDAEGFVDYYRGTSGDSEPYPINCGDDDGGGMGCGKYVFGSPDGDGNPEGFHESQPGKISGQRVLG